MELLPYRLFMNFIRCCLHTFMNTPLGDVKKLFKKCFKQSSARFSRSSYPVPGLRVLSSRCVIYLDQSAGELFQTGYCSSPIKIRNDERDGTGRGLKAL